MVRSSKIVRWTHSLSRHDPAQSDLHRPPPEMPAVTAYDTALAQGSTAAALALFDRLEPVDTTFMIGAWRGEGFPTGHPLDGVLEACHWRGKRFDSAEDVQPLVFDSLTGGPLRLNPSLMMPGMTLAAKLPLFKNAAVGRLFQTVMPLLATRRSRARLRMTEYRGKTSATMIYDSLPIHDVFRRLDDNTVLGVMDLKGMAQPFFFVLRRD